MTTAERNDNARKAMGVACDVVQTIGVSSLPSEQQSELREMVEGFDNFNEDNDPYKEHDFGKITMKFGEFFWKIDDYGVAYKDAGASHPLVLTIMQTDEY